VDDCLAILEWLEVTTELLELSETDIRVELSVLDGSETPRIVVGVVPVLEVLPVRENSGGLVNSETHDVAF
jgi:hypothetical protein